MEDAPPEKVSKFSWYLLISPETGAAPKVVRHLIMGWGADQHKSLLLGAYDHALSERDAITAVVASYGTEEQPLVRIEACFGNSKLAVDFPFRGSGLSTEYVPSLDDSGLQRELVQVVNEFAEKAVPKRLYGFLR